MLARMLVKAKAACTDPELGELLAHHLADELPENRVQEMMRHLEKCPTCKAEYDQEEELRLIMRAWEAEAEITTGHQPPFAPVVLGERHPRKTGKFIVPLLVLAGTLVLPALYFYFRSY